MGIPKSSQEQGFVDGSLLVASLIHFEWIWRQEWRLNNSCESLLHLSVLITNAVLCEIVAALPAKALHRIETKPMCATKACGKIVAENFPEFGSHTFCTVLVAFVCRHLRQVANDLRMFPTGSGWLRYGRMASNVSYLRARGGNFVGNCWSRQTFITFSNTSHQKRVDVQSRQVKVHAIQSRCFLFVFSWFAFCFDD